ncbi:amino acid/amide ABC transporter ATP-binding protein 2 (HAAT family) [Breoghania corrubedonensis]|uniref:Amino acid/amide ABC transporter ATP-binding protein 2 (HAAT family) n=1 Tax=Breoghania corrubedonensis TaxID=665038 RepID=A0A2T5VC66_9HYPH|nr:ABC transporter ATP-binding protein [Breoghania corrubedonensis]PTW61343.1 amino acid/amide ABC transporter ATP-binding protein 2 (HAAT family) [Breoghania corrubedonensis]
MLDLEDVHINRGGTHAVRGVSLTVGRGEIVSLIGANGAGKTTTLAAISGLLRPRKGKILFRPQENAPAIDLTTMKAEQIVAAGISHCPEARQIFGNLSVTENLKIGAYLRNDADGVARDLADIHARFPILHERGSVPGDKLSGGEQMMLAIGRALMSRPKLILFDEPSLGLAPILVEQIFEILETIRRDGVTVLLVEQNASMALEFSDRAYVIEAGEITLAGTGKELASNSDVQRAYLGAA